jgi:antitoxin PrlF
MLTSRITTKGQTTVPRAVRERLRLRPGDTIAYIAEGDRFVVVKVTPGEAVDDPFASFTEWAGDADTRAYAGL